MSDTFDHFDEAYEQACAMEEDGVEVFKYNKTCNHCGESGLYWEETEKGWRLFNHNSEQHTCFNSKPKPKINLTLAFYCGEL